MQCLYTQCITVDTELDFLAEVVYFRPLQYPSISCLYVSIANTLRKTSCEAHRETKLSFSSLVVEKLSALLLFIGSSSFFVVLTNLFYISLDSWIFISYFYYNLILLILLFKLFQFWSLETHSAAISLQYTQIMWICFNASVLALECSLYSYFTQPMFEYCFVQ